MNFPLSPMPQLPMDFLLILGVLAIFSIILKGIALWKAARNSQKKWFVVMLIVNTIGILELFYIFVFSKKKLSDKKNHE